MPKLRQRKAWAAACTGTNLGPFSGTVQTQNPEAKLHENRQRQCQELLSLYDSGKQTHSVHIRAFPFDEDFMDSKSQLSPLDTHSNSHKAMATQRGATAYWASTGHRRRLSGVTCIWGSNVTAISVQSDLWRHNTDRSFVARSDTQESISRHTFLKP